MRLRSSNSILSHLDVSLNYCCARIHKMVKEFKIVLICYKSGSKALTEYDNFLKNIFFPTKLDLIDLFIIQPLNYVQFNCNTFKNLFFLNLRKEILI